MIPDDLTLRDWLDVLAGSSRCLRCQVHDYADADTLCEHVTARHVVPEPSTTASYLRMGRAGLVAADEEPKGELLAVAFLPGTDACMDAHHPSGHGARSEWQRQWVIGHTLVTLFSTLSEWAREGEIAREVRDHPLHVATYDPERARYTWQTLIDGPASLPRTGAISASQAIHLAAPGTHPPTYESFSVGKLPRARAIVTGRAGGGEGDRRQEPVPGPHGCTHSGDWTKVRQPLSGREFHRCNDCGAKIAGVAR